MGEVYPPFLLIPMPLNPRTIGLLTPSALTVDERSWFDFFRPYAPKTWTPEVADDWAVRRAKSQAAFSDTGEAGRDREVFPSTLSVERVPKPASLFTR